MVLGGLNDIDEPFSSTKLFGTETGTWTDGPLMVLGRAQPLAVTLAGRSGARRQQHRIATRIRSPAEMLDPATGSWTETAPLPRLTWIDAMVGLADGTALAVGRFEGETESSPVAYIYDPAADTWGGRPGTCRGSDSSSSRCPTAARSPSVAPTAASAGGLADAPSTGSSRAGASGRTVTPMSTGRDEPQVVVLGDGRVLVAGGAADGHVAPDIDGDLRSGHGPLDARHRSRRGPLRRSRRPAAGRVRARARWRQRLQYRGRHALVPDTTGHDGATRRRIVARKLSHARRSRSGV